MISEIEKIGFKIKEDSWTDRADGTFTRSIKSVSRLFDISPVTYPAYEDTAVALRSKEQWTKNKHRSDLVAVELEILTNSI
jgi:phage head maturation protease